MTLYKIFKENEFKKIVVSDDTNRLYIKTSKYPSGELFLYKEVDKLLKNRHKQTQLAIIDGVIEMIDIENTTFGYTYKLSCFKDKLLAEKKLIEENK